MRIHNRLKAFDKSKSAQIFATSAIQKLKVIKIPPSFNSFIAISFM